MAKKGTAKTKTTGKAKPDTTAIRGLFILCAGVALLLSLYSFARGQEMHNWIGLVGFTVGKLLHAVFGLSSYLFCIYIIWIGWRWLFCKPINHPNIKALYLVILAASLCIILSLIEDNLPAFANELSSLFYPNHRKSHYHLGGALFYYLYRDLPGFNLLHIFNTTGVALLSCSALLASGLFLTKTTPSQLLEKIVNFFARFKRSEEDLQPATVEPIPSEPFDTTRFVKVRIPDGSNQHAQTPLQSQPSKDAPPPVSSSPDLLAIQPETNLTVRPSVSNKEQTDRKRMPPPDETPPKKKEEPVQKKRQNALAAQRVHNGDFKNYRIPEISLLTNAKKVDQSSLKQDLRRQAEVLEETLQSFGIEAKVGQINCGPTITSFEVHPAIGVKVQKIKTLENDIALNMEAKSIRIIAPIPGKAAVGIEVPNANPQEVSFKEMLLAYQQSGRKFHIPILLGKAVNGDYVMSDLAKMPHCIIAGATGSGKSVCINTIVMSILLNAKPDEIKLVMIDPKKVELTPYAKLPHMLAPVITEPLGACAALNWLVKEMENRYEIFKQLGVRNIDAFNTRAINKELEASLEQTIPAHMPYIVVIIDELADLMMVASNDIETPIARIAQMARAVGIHLILATQRPSREVITGLIKANFPTRISFKVASRVNSQIVLDEIGAESLLGNGDMLFLPPGSSTLIRAQGAFIRDEDIMAVVTQICEQAPPNYVIASFDKMGREASSADSSEASGDSLYAQAVDVVLNTGNASTTFLQRKLKIGYARAASLMDQMEAQSVIGPADGAKPRKIFASSKAKSEEAGMPDEANPFDDE